MAEKAESIAGLAAAASRGDRQALNRLTDLFYKDIFRMAYYRTFSRMDAEDIAQDVFVRMTEKLPGLNDKTLFRSWLYRIAVNRVNDFLRRKKITAIFSPWSGEGMDVPSQDPGPNNTLEKKEFTSLLKSFASTLGRWERETFLLRFLDHLEIGEIALTLKKNENTVKTHLYRAIAKFKQNDSLRQWLKGYEE